MTAADHAAALAEMERAIDLARGGNDAALASARDLVGRFPADPTFLHKAGVVSQLLGREDDALAYFHRVLGVLPGFPYTLLEIGNTHRQAGRKAEALGWFEQAAQPGPVATLAAARAARLARELDEPGRALAILERACRTSPGDVDLQAHRAELLIYHDRRDEAADAYARVVASPAAAHADHIAYLYLLCELGRYDAVLSHAAGLDPPPGSALGTHARLLSAHARLAAGHDHAAVAQAAAAREGSDRWLPPDSVLARIRGAIADREPFSLVRFGDGEARFLATMDPSLNPWLQPADALAVGQSIWTNWFGVALKHEDPANLARLHQATLDAMATASVLGVPTAARIARDRLHRGYLATLDRQVGRLPPGPMFTDASIAGRLHQSSPFLEALLDGLDSLTVIGPHPGLAARLARRFAIPEPTEILVPGELRLPDEARGHGGRHFPDVFDTVLASLRPARRGAVFLVAAGLLGKVYCARVKALGGIALDVGSVVDAWMGYDTRPGQFAALPTWRLPG